MRDMTMKLATLRYGVCGARAGGACGLRRRRSSSGGNSAVSDQQYGNVPLIVSDATIR